MIHCQSARDCAISTAFAISEFKLYLVLVELTLLLFQILLIIK